MSLPLAPWLLAAQIQMGSYTLDWPPSPAELALVVSARAQPLAVTVDGQAWDPGGWTEASRAAEHRCWKAAHPLALSQGAHTVAVSLPGGRTRLWTGMVGPDASALVVDARGVASADLVLGDQAYHGARLAEAIAHYKAALGAYPRGELHDQTAYKLAVSYGLAAHAPAELHAAQERYLELLDQTRRHGASESDLVARIQRALAASLVAEADFSDHSASALDVAQGFLDAHQGRTDLFPVFRALPEVLTMQARYDDTIAVLAWLQERWPTAPDDPSLQMEAAQLEMRRSPPDPEALRRGLDDLVDQYGENSPWALANHKNLDALATADRYIEQSLATLATGYHLSAEKTGSMGDYQNAAERYREYLELFPAADDYEEIQSYLGIVLVKLNRLPEAEHLFDQLSRHEGSPYAESSLWQLMQVRKQMLIDQYGQVEELPKDAVEERRVALPSGKERIIYQLDSQHERFIAVADALVAAQFTDVNYAPSLNQYRAALAYLPAQILYNFGRFDEARPRFQKVIDTWPKTDEAAYSARLIVDSYADEENLEGVRHFAGIYATGGFGPRHDRWGDVVEMPTAYEEAVRLAEKGDNVDAAKAFQSYLEADPKSQLAQKALYNAANQYEIAGQITDADRLFEQYVNEYPRDELSASLLYRIASNYSAILDLNTAIRYYETLARNFPTYADAPGALYNAGFLRLGIGDIAGAARTFEQYAVEYPDQKDAEDVFSQAVDTWARVGPAEADAASLRYLHRFPDQNPDHVLDMTTHLARDADRSGNAKASAKAWADVAGAYTRLAPTGKLGPEGRHAAATAALRKLEAEARTFESFHWTARDATNDRLVQAKTAALQALHAHAEALIAAYDDFETSAEARYLEGEATLTFADRIGDAPCSSDLSAKACASLRDRLDEIHLPVQGMGEAILAQDLALASGQKRWSVWQTRAQNLLADRDPLRYGPDLDELRGAYTGSPGITAGPMGRRPPPG